MPDPAGNVPETATRTVSVTDTKIPYHEMLNITSDNANNTRATINDILTITLETNETLAGANITALNGTFQMITENDTVTVNLPVPANHPTGNATFNITARDAQNHTLYVTDANLTSGYVFVDTIKPNLTINGNETIIVELYSEYVENGANVTDEDPAYNYTITSNTSAVNSRIPGTYLIEYMAQPDPAGNIPETATRTVSVTDTKIPYHEMLNITSDNANNTRATINDILTITLETNETLAGANITALNGTFQMITENDTVTINLPVPANHPTGNATFNITARDAQNHTLYVTDANLTSGYVFVDTIKPNLTINGNETIIVELYSEYVENGANVTDEDPAYNYTITSNTSAVNSRIPGTYLIEYMAQPDPAGNVPETATRTVSVTDTKIPYHEMLNITSDNANNTRATINDILTITLETNETLAGANITALNGTFQMITENDTVTVNIPVTANHSTGNATFNITARDAQNHTLYVTDANLTSGYVFVDTIKPNLTINGNETIIVELYSEYVENGANVTDEDPAYNYTITSNTSAVNSRIPGTYLIEYMAQPDPAGNIPETATRTVSVTDTKIPYHEMLNITSDNANNTRATINDILTITLETNETLAGANITALNGTFQMITENDTVTINLPVPANHPTGNATFNITARDAQNHTLYVTDANLTSGYVFVDTIKPNLTINGNETIIVELYSEYVENGANVTDEDPAYNYTITSNTSAVNSRIPGTYLIEYMAQPDPAGNVPETATRTVSVTDTKIPYHEMLNITSDNANNTRATINDILTITLETNETLAGANITALNGTFQMITENDTVTINLPVPANHPTGNATFNITARDAQNHTLYVTDANLTSGYVFVDTIKPNLTINGNETIIVELYSEYVENGANVTDEDPAYNYTITSNTSAVNSRIPGTYLIEYMAQPDPAGNVPETATRTVSVTDTKMPYHEMLNITSDNANNTRATINDILTITLETNETLAGANITALNGTFQMITENDTVTINLPVPANHPTGNATFNITARDAQNHTLYVTDANLTSGYVFVDTIKPNLTINGNETIIVELYSEYVENGANVTDEDPAYNYTITSNTSAVNSRIPGTYLIEYMAQPDPAGNVPETATRTVSVTDTKMPYHEMLNITSDNANNTRATMLNVALPVE